MTLIVVLAACSPRAEEVVIYVSHDRVLSEPILRKFEADTGIHVRALYDIEASKSVGLTNRLLAEANSPRADVFWNNEVVQTIRLQTRGVAAAESLPNVPIASPRFADPSRSWVGFAARARVLLLNKNAPEFGANASSPSLGLWDLAEPRWRGRAALANPHFGTTGTHLAALLTLWGEPEFRRWLKALRLNEVAVLPGNAQVREAVSSGRYDLGLTDTDDAAEALHDRAQVLLIFPDQQSGFGTLLIPNTVSLIARGPHPQAGARLVSYLLSSEVESSLPKGRGAQLPINHAVPPPEYLPPLDRIRVMHVDFKQVAMNFERMLSMVEQEWPPNGAQTAY